jgi:cephalosporin hydroxylase
MTAPEPVQGRDFASALPTPVLDRVQVGTMRQTYRGVPFLKSPFDIALYLDLLGRLQPGTVIEIGTKFGGSALWFADMMTAMGGDARVISIDIDLISKVVDDPRIDLVHGDALQLEKAFSADLLSACPRPWLVVEDSSHMYDAVAAVLQFFHPLLEAGDHIVVEDGVVGQLSGHHYRQYENGPNRAVADFLSSYGDHYEIVVDLCDRFGHNVTYNPNGWLRRL